MKTIKIIQNIYQKNTYAPTIPICKGTAAVITAINQLQVSLQPQEVLNQLHLVLYACYRQQESNISNRHWKFGISARNTKNSLKPP